jgi:hypothetical protein
MPKCNVFFQLDSLQHIYQNSNLRDLLSQSYQWRIDLISLELLIVNLKLSYVFCRGTWENQINDLLLHLKETHS